MHIKANRGSNDADYKAEAVRVVIKRNNVMSVTRELSGDSSTLQRWG